MPDWIDIAHGLWPRHFAASHGLLAAQWLTYFLAGRGVFAAFGRGRSSHVVAYVAVGAIAWHALTFALLFAGVASLQAAHTIALLPFVYAIWRQPRRAVAFSWGWAAVASLCVVVATAPAAAGLFHARPACWDEFTQWAIRPRQIFLLDRLATAADPAAAVFPSYGLYANFLAIWCYVLHGREAAGAATVWSVLTGVLIALHCYEYLRRFGAPALLAGPACTAGLAFMIRGQDLLFTSLYADIHVVCGGMLAALHGPLLLGDGSPRRDAPEGRFTHCAGSTSEDAILAGAGLAILVFSKATGQVVALSVAAYVGVLFLLRVLRGADFRLLLKRLTLAAAPAVLLAMVWSAYVAWSHPGDEQLLIQQSERFAGKMTLNWRDPRPIAGALWQNLWRTPPYAALLAALPVAWLAHLALGIVAWSRKREAAIAAPRTDRSAGPAALALFAPLLFAAYVCIYELSPTLPPEDVNRYAAAMIPAMLVYEICIAARLASATLPAQGRRVGTS